MKWKSLILAAVLVPAGVLTFLNVRDYRRYKFITELERHVTPEQFAAMARVCEGKERWGKGSNMGAELRQELSVLVPEGVSFSDKGCEVKLYQRGNAYAYLWLSTSSRNQKAHVFYDFDAWGQKGRDVWLKDPAAEAQFSPNSRVLTLVVWTLGPDREFVVTRDSLIVFSRESGWSEIVARRDLAEAEVQKLRAAIGRIGQEPRGKAYEAGGLDGCTMVFRFSADGTPADQDVLLKNTWCTAMDEVVAVLTEIAPAECPLPPRGWMQSPDPSVKPRIFPICELNRSEVPLGYPWWLVWPRLVLGVKG